MLIIYDFKTPVTEGGDLSEKAYEDFLSLRLNKIFENFKSCIKKGDFYKKDLLIQSKIIKKSLDLRQKEPKIVFKAVINVKIKGYEISAGKGADTADTSIDATRGIRIGIETEDAILECLLKSKIKARKADEAEEYFFYGDKNNILKNKGHADTSGKNGRAPAIVRKNRTRILIVGMGPAGIFAAVSLINNGIRPVIIEKGKRVEDRTRDISDLFANAKFNEKSNVVFGEGGAGTFSDGKLTTRRNDPLVAYILNFLVKMGAKRNILTEHKPHLGSDELIHILKNIRDYLIKNGAEIYYEEELTDIITDSTLKWGVKPLRLCSVTTDRRDLKADFLIMASGSNSYGTYELLKKSGVYMEKKPFAIGFRIEHKRDFINRLFFKGGRESKECNAGGKKGDLNCKTYEGDKGLESVYYNITSKGFGGYSFCMCPGGFVINSSSKENHLCINGMSYSGRDFENSNSAIVATVRPEILDGMNNDILSSNMGGLIFRQDIEKAAYKAGGGDFAAPFQPTVDYIGEIINEVKKVKALKNKGVDAGMETGLFKGHNNCCSMNLNFCGAGGIDIISLLDKFQFSIKSLPKNSLSSTRRFADLPEPSYKPAVQYYSLFNVIPDFLNIFIAGSLVEFEMRLGGFIANSVLTAVEAGTSSAVRIKRGDNFESVSVKGLYPCGEGSGYSGGIITSAMDGIKCSMAIIESIKMDLKA